MFPMLLFTAKELGGRCTMLQMLLFTLLILQIPNIRDAHTITHTLAQAQVCTQTHYKAVAVTTAPLLST